MMTKIEMVDVVSVERQAWNPRRILGHIKVNKSIADLCEEKKIRLLNPDQIFIDALVTQTVYYEQLERRLNPGDRDEQFKAGQIQLNLEFDLDHTIRELDPVLRGTITRVHFLK